MQVNSLTIYIYTCACLHTQRLSLTQTDRHKNENKAARVAGSSVQFTHNSNAREKETSEDAR